jgi:hypothetical protein
MDLLKQRLSQLGYVRAQGHCSTCNVSDEHEHEQRHSIPSAASSACSASYFDPGPNESKHRSNHTTTVPAWSRISDHNRYIYSDTLRSWYDRLPCIFIYLFVVTSAQLRSRCDVWLALRASLQTAHHVLHAASESG